jgi:hypothetical protein
MMHKLMLWRPSAVPHGVGRMGAAACVCLILVTAACSGANADVEKAQIAVRANPDLELIATDDRQGVLTVGVKSSGQTITVEVRDVLSGTAFRNLATASAESRRTDQAAVATGELEFGGRGEYRRPQLAVGATGPLSFLSSTGIFNDDRYFDLFVEYAKAGPESVLIQITVHNRGPEAAKLRVLPTLWFRNTWS